MEAVFCGHDHDNDFWGDYNGIKLFYGRKTGYGGYGPPWYMQRGARVIEFSVADDDSVTMDSWIREENGNTVEKQGKFPTWAKFQQNYCAGMKPHEDKFIAQLHQSRQEQSLSSMLTIAQQRAADFIQ